METSSEPNRAVRNATFVGTALQLLMVAAGHYSPAVARMFPAGGMSISALAGVMAALGSRPASLGSAAGRGALAGGVRLRGHPGLVSSGRRARGSARLRYRQLCRDGRRRRDGRETALRPRGAAGLTHDGG
jgi:hypothetical protein